MSFRVFVINLKRRPDRLAAVRTVLPPRWLEVAEFTTEWPGPVDGEQIQDSAELKTAEITLYDGWKLPKSTNDWWNREMKCGEIGCAFSHLSVWRRAQQAFEQDENLKYVVVLEDDVYSKVANFDEQVDDVIKKFDASRKSWDLLYLGRVLQGGYKDFPTEISGIVRPGFSYCLYAYCLSRTGVQRVLAAEFQNHFIPVDEFLPACFTMHPRKDVSQLFPPVLRAFSVDPYLLFQRTKNDGGSDTENSKAWKK